jgi:protein-disulfide isomerase
MKHIGAVAVWTALASAVMAQPQPPQLAIASAVPDAGGRTLTITGSNFGPRPFVTLDLVPLNVQVAVDTQIVAAAPLDVIPPGTYLLTVTRGPSARETASQRVTLGASAAKPERVPAPDIANDVLATSLSTSGDQPAATVGDRVITLAEVDREWQRTEPGAYLGISREVYENRRRVVNAMVADEVLRREASTRGMTTEALLAEEVPKRVVTMPDSALLSLYQGLGDRTRGASLEQMRPALRAWLEIITEPELARMNYVEELMRVSTRAEVLLTPPRVTIRRTADDPVLGPDSAAVEIIVFGDFQSTEYARFASSLNRVRDTFGNRVRIVFKHLPILGEPSVIAAEAAACAHRQSRFWNYHDALLAPPGTVGPTRLKQVATDVGLNRGDFDRCLDGGERRDFVQDELKEAGQYDVSVSPTFLVNGRHAPVPPTFLPPFEFFTRIIEEELLVQSKAASPAR